MNDLISLDDIGLPRAAGPKRYAGRKLHRPIRAFGKEVNTEEELLAQWDKQNLRPTPRFGDAPGDIDIVRALHQHLGGAASQVIQQIHQRAHDPYLLITLRDHVRPEHPPERVHGALNHLRQIGLLGNSYQGDVNDKSSTVIRESRRGRRRKPKRHRRRRYGAMEALQEQQGADAAGTAFPPEEPHSDPLSPEALHSHATKILASGGKSAAATLRGRFQQLRERYGLAGATAIAGAYLGVYAAAAVLGPKVFLAFPWPSGQIAGAAEIISRVLGRRKKKAAADPLKQRRRGRRRKYANQEIEYGERFFDPTSSQFRSGGVLRSRREKDGDAVDTAVPGRMRWSVQEVPQQHGVVPASAVPITEKISKGSRRARAVRQLVKERLFRTLETLQDTDDKQLRALSKAALRSGDTNHLYVLADYLDDKHHVGTDSRFRNHFSSQLRVTADMIEKAIPDYEPPARNDPTTTRMRSRTRRGIHPSPSAEEWNEALSSGLTYAPSPPPPPVELEEAPEEPLPEEEPAPAAAELPRAGGPHANLLAHRQRVARRPHPPSS